MENDEIASERERYWISYYDAMNPKHGYNKTGGGECASGFKMSKEATQKATKTRKEHYAQGLYKIEHTEESKRKLRESWARRKANGYKMSDETRKKLSESKKGQKWSEEQRQKTSDAMQGENNPFYGKHHTDETRKKIADKATGRHHTEESKRKMSESRKGKNNYMYGRRGELCPHYGKKAIHNSDGDIIYVFPGEIEEYLNKGYILGKPNTVNDNICDSKFKWYYVYDNVYYKGVNNILKYFHSNGYETFSSTTLEKICKGITVKGYESLTGKITKVRREDIENKESK